MYQEAQEQYWTKDLLYTFNVRGRLCGEVARIDAYSNVRQCTSVLLLVQPYAAAHSRRQIITTRHTVSESCLMSFS